MIAIVSFREKIEKQRDKILAAIGRLKKEDPFAVEDRSIIVEPGTDAADLLGHEQAVILEDKLKKDLKEIEAALIKIKKGTYGVCERCGKKIESGRISVKPQAIYCLKCEKLLENKK